jgi:DNA mismatch repair protein MutS
MNSSVQHTNWLNKIIKGINMNPVHFYKKVVATSVVLCFAINLGVSAIEVQSKVYERIATQHLPAFATRETLETQNQIKEKKINVEAHRQGKHFDIQIPQLGDIEKLRLLYKLFSSTESIQELSDQEKYTEDFFGSINMFCGKKETPTDYLFKHLDHTQTSAGKIQLQKMLMQSSCDTTLLAQRQSIIKALVDNAEIFDALDEHMKQLAEAESSILWFFKESDPLAEQLMDSAYFKNGFFKRFNQNATMLEADKLRMQLIVPTIALALPVIIPFAAHSLSRVVKSKEISPKKFIRDINNVLAGSDIDDKILLGLGLGVSLISGIVGLYLTLPKAIKSQKVYNIIQEKMMGPASYINAAKTIGNLLAEEETLSELAPVLHNTAAPQQVHKLLTMLEKPTFTSDPTFFSHQGRALAAFKIMQAVKDNLIASIKAVGQLDAYLSLAKLYKAHENNPQAPFCFAEFVSEDKPRIAVDNFWMLGAINTPGLHSIKLDDKNQGALITCPHNSEDSMVIQSLALTLHCAQSLGIAPARSLTLTPFTTLLPVMTPAISDGTQTACEVAIDRSLKLLHTMQQLRTSQSLKKHDLGIILLNEPFAGADYKTALAGTYALTKSLVETTESLCVCSSSMPELSLLEEKTNGLIQNYHVAQIGDPLDIDTSTQTLTKGSGPQEAATSQISIQKFIEALNQATH